MTINGYSESLDEGTTPASANTLAVGNNAVLKIELSGSETGNGLKIEAANSTVKGLVISNWENGVFLNVGATDNQVMGNYIGTDAAGDTTLGNNIGVVVKDTNSTIGGTNPAARNIISGNSGFGVNISGGTETKVQGNYIGTKKDGISALGNNYGVVIESAPENTIGGTTAAARNIISHNTLHGIFIRFPGATDNTVQGNIINGNGNSGVEVLFEPTFGPEPPTGNRILSNSIYDNDFLGIDLVHSNDPAGVTLNDVAPLDPDEGPNNLQNFPVITSAKVTTKRIGGHRRKVTLIKGTLNSEADKTYNVQFFGSPVADPSGNGEGKKFLGQKSVKTDSSGDATFTFQTRKKVPNGQVVTATATSPSGDTSEFSKACTVPGVPCP